jgi:hypothetical protein
MRTTLLSDDVCPFCGHPLDAATAVPANGEAVPEAGDVSACLNCAGLMIFDEALRVRKPTTDELREAMSLPETIQLVAAIRYLHRRNA